MIAMLTKTVRCSLGTLAAIFLAATAWSQEAAPPMPAAPAGPAAPSGPMTYAELLARRPYDVIITTKAANAEVRQVIPIPRPLPEMPKPSDKLVVQMLTGGDEQFEIRWFDIERIDLFEQIVLGEANQLVAGGQLDEAFDYFRYLLEYYPKTAGLAAAHQKYLYECIVDARKRDSYHEALAIAEELYGKNNSFRAADDAPPILDEIGQIADRLIEAYIKKDDFRSGKILLKRLESKFGIATPFVRAWRLRLSEIAAKHRDEAARRLAADDFVEAYDACAAMINVWPDVEGGAALAAEIARRYPLVIVGVSQPALSHDPRHLADPAARRTGRLLERRLMEFAGLGPDGGNYKSALGTFEQSDDRLELTFALKAAESGSAAAYTGFDVAQHLLDLADPAGSQYQPQWARLLQRVEVRRVGRVDVKLRVPHVLPQAFLQTSYDPTDNLGAPGVKGSGPYFVLAKADKLSRFTRNDRYTMFVPGQPAEIMERYHDDSKRGLLALQRAEVDVLDSVFPGDVPELQQNKDIAVGRYSVPTVHFLTIARRHPYLGNRTFRRALVYAINRKAILETSLLKLPADAAPPPGFREISAPFPAPINAADATAYAYDESIEPRPFNPLLAFVLRTVASNEIKSQFEAQQKQAPALAPLVLGHPADEVSRIACRAMVRQWKPVGIEVKTLEFPPGVVADLKEECDLVYTHGATWEPIVDAGRLLAPGGLAPADNTYVSLMLRRVEAARDWVEARAALRDLHRQLHEDVAVIPLWQTFDYYAWRTSVQGIKDGQASLYETVDQWRVAPRLEAK